MPLGDVLKLKSEIGSTAFREVVLGKKKSQNKPAPDRAARNESDDEAPLEMSSKHRVPFLSSERVRQRRVRVRDPRFDFRCGEFKNHKFRENFNFVFEMKQEELVTLKRQLRETDNEDEKEKIRFLIQRTKNQLTDHKKQMEANKKRQEEAAEAAVEGHRPMYVKKKDKKMSDLVEKYVELKNSGKLQSHIEKRRKKSAGKIKKKMDL